MVVPVTGYFKNFLVNIEKVWARKGRRWVARWCGYDCTYITAMVCVSAIEKTVTPALLWTGKMVPGRLFSKEACLVFIKATQGGSHKDNQKAIPSSDTKAHDNRKKQKETRGGWFDAATFMEWVREVFVAKVQQKTK